MSSMDHGASGEKRYPEHIWRKAKSIVDKFDAMVANANIHEPTLSQVVDGELGYPRAPHVEATRDTLVAACHAVKWNRSQANRGRHPA